MTEKEAMKAVDRMSILKYFPTSETARDEIVEMILSMVQTDKWGDEKDKLNWLVGAMRDDVGEWPGPAEFRAVYCCKYKPSDGKEKESELPGFCGFDQEQGIKAACLSAPAAAVKYLPQPGDTVIEPEFFREIEAVADAKREKIHANR